MSIPDPRWWRGVFNGAPQAPRPPDVTYDEQGNPCIRARPGLSVRVHDAGLWATPANLFAMTAFLSAVLENKPVRCTGLLPGVSLRCQASCTVGPALHELLLRQWAHAQPALTRWIETAEHTPCIELSLPQATVLLGLDKYVKLDPGVMQVEILRPWQA